MRLGRDKQLTKVPCREQRTRGTEVSTAKGESSEGEG